jgi:large subunit ribosomal protein L35
MPKQKTHSGLKKRLKVTATGKLLRRRAPKSHGRPRQEQSAKQKRSYRDFVEVHPADARRLRKLIGRYRGAK